MNRIDLSVFQAQAWPPAAVAELRSLQAEDDPELLFEQLLNLGGRLELARRPEAAVELYAKVVQEAPAVGAGHVQPLRIRAQNRVDALSGRGALGPRAEILLRRLTQETADPVVILSLAAASGVYSLTRLATLSRLLQAPAGWATRGLGARGFASLAGFAVEAPVFTLAGRLGREAWGAGQDWLGGGLGRDLASSYLVLGGFKLAGWAVGSTYRGLAPTVGAGHVQPLRILFQQGGTLSGILLGHALETHFGLRPKQDSAATLLDSLAFLLQGHVAGRLSSRLLGGRLATWNRALDHLAAGMPAGSASGIVLTTPALAAAGPRQTPSRLQAPLSEPRILMMSAPEGGGRGSSRPPGRPPPDPSWLAKFLQALERHPHWIALLRGSSPTPPPEAEIEGAPYRRSAKAYATLSEARQLSVAARRNALDPAKGLGFRTEQLSKLPELLSELRFDAEYGRALHALEGLILKPKISYPPVPGWPEVLLLREIPLPYSVAEFYRQDRVLRLQAADLYVDLQRRNPVGAPAIRQASTVLAGAVLDPRLDTKYRTYFREDIWSRSYFSAEADLRRDFLKRYLPIAQRLPMGSQEARAGVAMLVSPKLLRLVQGEGPIPDYLTDPELLLDMMRVYGNLLRLLPSSLPEVQRADRVLSPALTTFGERAMEGEAAAIEVLALFAQGDPSARQFLKILAEQGNPVAKKLIKP